MVIPIIAAAAVLCIVAAIYISRNAVIEIKPEDLSREERNLILAEIERDDVVLAIAASQEQGFIPMELVRQRRQTTLAVETARAALTTPKARSQQASQPGLATLPVEVEAPIGSIALGSGLVAPSDNQ